MNTCDTCKHWGRQYKQTNLRCCDQAGGYPDDINAPDELCQYSTPTIGVYGGSLLSGDAIVTSPNFGCVLWEAK